MSQASTVTYGNLTLGSGQGDDNYVLTGKHRHARGTERAMFTFEVLVSAETVAAFQASESALEEEFSTPNQALDVDLGGVDRFTYDTALGAGLSALSVACEVEKVPSESSTDRSALYRVTCEIDLPAGYESRLGRRTATVDIDTDPQGKRTATFEGVYTALASDSARTQFEEQVETWATSALPTGTWELVGTPLARADDRNRTLRFSRTYREVKKDQGSGAANLAAIVEPQLVIRRARTSVDSSQEMGSVAPLEELEVEYEAGVKWSETTDLKGLWEGTLRPYVLTDVADYAEGTVIVTSEKVSGDEFNNRLSVQMRVLADPGAKFYQARVEWSEKRDHGVILKPVWNGNPRSRDRYQGHTSEVRTLKRTTVGPGQAQSSFGFPAIESHGEPPELNGWIEVRDSRRPRRFTIGIAGEEYPLEAITTSYTYVRADVENDAVSGPSRERGSDGGGFSLGAI